MLVPVCGIAAVAFAFVLGVSYVFLAVVWYSITGWFSACHGSEEAYGHALARPPGWRLPLLQETDVDCCFISVMSLDRLRAFLVGTGCTVLGGAAV